MYLVLSQINRIKCFALPYATWRGPHTSVWTRSKGLVARVYNLEGNGACLIFALAQIEQSPGISGKVMSLGTALDNPLTPMWPIRRCKNRFGVVKFRGVDTSYALE